MALALGVACQSRPSGGGLSMTPNGPGSRWSRRRVLTPPPRPGRGPGLCRGWRRAGLRGVLPGRSLLEDPTAPARPAPPLDFALPGPSADGTFYSVARRRTVGYTIAYPPGHRRGRVAAGGHAARHGGNHANALAGMSPAQAVALKSGGRPRLPMALVTVDLRRRLLEPAPRRRPDGDGGSRADPRAASASVRPARRVASP